MSNTQAQAGKTVLRMSRPIEVEPVADRRGRRQIPTRPLGRCGIEVSEVGFGAWGLGGVYYGPVSEGQGIETVRAYLDSGGNHIDSAHEYHKSEEIVGKAIRGYDRESLVIVSKSFRCHPDEFDDLHRELGITLRDLNTDYVDVYYLHGPPHDHDTMHAVLDEFVRLRESGRIRAIAVSIQGPDVTDRKVEQGLAYVRSGKIDAIQMAYSIFRQKSAVVFREAMAHGVGAVARSVYESGFLTGKYKPGHRFVWPDQRTRYEDAHRDAILAEVAKLQPVAEAAGYSNTAELAARFALAAPFVSSIILGAVKPVQSQRNAALAALPPLGDTVVAQLRERYESLNDAYNPTGDFEHVPSPRS